MFSLFDKIPYLLKSLVPTYYDKSIDQAIQRSVFLQYKANDYTEDFDSIGFGNYSQSNEDGILLYIFSKIGFKHYSCIDIGAALPYGSNTTNLICNFGWDGLLIEGNKQKCNISNRFFKTHRYTKSYPPRIINKNISIDNVNTLVESMDKVDLLSLDIDGIDYWVLKKLESVKPRVIVLEYNNLLGADRSIAVKYSEDFYQNQLHAHYNGASLLAFEELAKEKGYDLIGTNRYGYNAFFLRSDINVGLFPIFTTEECFNKPSSKSALMKKITTAKQQELLELDWEDV